MKRKNDLFIPGSSGSGGITRGGPNIIPEKQDYESAMCAHCSGIGCLYCNKTGTVLVASPKRPCYYCEGVGCIYCGFTGWAGPKGKYD